MPANRAFTDTVCLSFVLEWKAQTLNIRGGMIILFGSVPAGKDEVRTMHKVTCDIYTAPLCTPWHYTQAFWKAFQWIKHFLNAHPSSIHHLLPSEMSLSADSVNFWKSGYYHCPGQMHWQNLGWFLHCAKCHSLRWSAKSVKSSNGEVYALLFSSSFTTTSSSWSSWWSERLTKGEIFASNITCKQKKMWTNGRWIRYENIIILKC